MDWREACNRFDLMFADDDDGLSALARPEVGNGNIATVVGRSGSIVNPHVFVAGVFNGCGQKRCQQVGATNISSILVFHTVTG